MRVVGLQITEQEAGTLQQLLDAAAKFGGRQMAQPVAYWDHKLQTAFSAPQYQPGQAGEEKPKLEVVPNQEA